MVHAERVKGDVADDHELVVPRIVGKCRQRERLLLEQLRERGGDAAWRVAQAGLGDVAAECGEQVADGLLRGAQVDALRPGSGLGMQRCDGGGGAHDELSVVVRSRLTRYSA